MIDITNELAGLQAATTGSQIRSAIISALSALNDALPSTYDGSYYIHPSTIGYFFSVSGKVMTDDLYVLSYPAASLISHTFSSNGIYQASAYSANGFGQVTVSVPLTSYWSGTESAYGSLSEYQNNVVYLVTSDWASQIDKIYIGSSLIWPAS